MPTQFYRDHEDVLLRVTDNGIPAVLWPDGTWHVYPDAHMADAKPLTAAGAKVLASGAALDAPAAPYKGTGAPDDGSQ
jgi:hypothetical protein